MEVSIAIIKVANRPPKTLNVKLLIVILPT